jgi:NAD(P)H dehydrogenase (quinone)
MTTYAVTGSTGHLGRLVVKELLARGVPATDVVALARDPEKAAALGVPVRRADYADPATLADALAGVDVLLLVSGSEVGQRLPQHTAVIEAAKAAGVQRVAYTSIAHADHSANPLVPEHKTTEDVLRASGLPVTILRDNWYLETYTGPVPQDLATGEVLGSTATRASAATRADMAVAITAARRGHGGRYVRTLRAADHPRRPRRAITDVTGTRLPQRHGRGADGDPARPGWTTHRSLVVALEESVARGDLDVRGDDLEHSAARRPPCRRPRALGLTPARAVARQMELRGRRSRRSTDSTRRHSRPTRCNWRPGQLHGCPST